MRQFSANFAVFLAYIFGAFFGAFLQENCQKIVWQFCIFFKLFCDDFLWDCVQGWKRWDPGQNAAIPNGDPELEILVSAARCQRKARL